MVRKTKEEAERTYHALLDAAAALFLQKGIAKTTLNDIAKAAGMTRGAVYWHFDNKDKVIIALWERNAAVMHQQFCQRFRQLATDDAPTEFRNTLLDMIQRIDSDTELSQAIRIVLHSVEFTDEQTDLQRYLHRQRDDLHLSIEQALVTLQQQDALQSGNSPEQLAHALMSYLHGLIHNHLKPGERILDLQQDGTALLDLFLRAILKEQPGRLG